MRILPILALALLATACAPTARQAFGPRINRARTEGIPLLVYALGVPGEIQTEGANTAVPVYVQFIVTSEEPLAKVRFTLAGYTVRGLPVRTHGVQRAIELIGPGLFHPEGNYEVNSFHARPAGFPGGDVDCIKMVQMEVFYINGKRKVYDARALQRLLLPPLRKGCGDRGPPVDFVDGG